jgi:methyl-accepting chemotaxis protein
MKNIRFAPKLLFVLVLLALTATVLSWRGIAGMGHIRADLILVEQSVERISNSGRSTANLLSYARAVEFLPLDLSAEQRGKFEAAAIDENRRFKARLDQLEPQLSTNESRQAVREIRTTLARYEVEAM